MSLQELTRSHQSSPATPTTHNYKQVQGCHAHHPSLASRVWMIVSQPLLPPPVFFLQASLLFNQPQAEELKQILELKCDCSLYYYYYYVLCNYCTVFVLFWCSTLFILFLPVLEDNFDPFELSHHSMHCYA